MNGYSVKSLVRLEAQLFTIEATSDTIRTEASNVRSPYQFLINQVEADLGDHYATDSEDSTNK